MIDWSVFEGRRRIFAKAGIAAAIASMALGAIALAVSFSPSVSEAGVSLLLIFQLVISLVAVAGMAMFYGAKISQWRRNHFAPSAYPYRLTLWFPLGFACVVAGTIGFFITVSDPKPRFLDFRGQPVALQADGTPEKEFVYVPGHGTLEVGYKIDPEPIHRNQLWRGRAQIVSFIGLAMFCPANAPRRRKPKTATGPAPQPLPSPA